MCVVACLHVYDTTDYFIWASHATDAPTCVSFTFPVKHKVMAAMNIFIHPQTHCQSDLDRALAPPACHLLAQAFGFLMMAIGLVIT